LTFGFEEMIFRAHVDFVALQDVLGPEAVHLCEHRANVLAIAPMRQAARRRLVVGRQNELADWIVAATRPDEFRGVGDTGLGLDSSASRPPTRVTSARTTPVVA